VTELEVAIMWTVATTDFSFSGCEILLSPDGFLIGGVATKLKVESKSRWTRLLAWAF